MMLNKKPNEIPKPNNVRFIAIASILMKTIESVVLMRIKEKITKNLSKSQLGFVEEGECGIHTVQLYNQLRKLRDSPGSSLKYYAIFIDFKSAFNKVNHQRLFEKCTMVGIEDDTLNIIKLLFSNIKLQLGEEQINFNAGTP